MKLFAISAFAIALTTTAASAQTASNVLEDTTLSVTALSGPLDFTIEGDRDGATELEVGLTTFDHSYGNVDAALRFAIGTDLRGSDNLYGRVEYNFGTEVAANLVVYGSAAVQYTTDTKLNNGLWTFDPSLGASYAITDTVGVFAEVGYTWELNQTKRDLGGYVEVGVPFAVTDSLYITPSVSRTFRTGANETSAHLNLTYQF
jgi:hypothetical protein